MFTYPGLFLLYAVLSSCLAMAMNFFGVVGIFSGGLMEMAAFNFIPLMRTHAAPTFWHSESDSSLASSSF